MGSRLPVGTVKNSTQNGRPERRYRRGITMLSLILAGEVIFVLPFHPGRYFKSSLLSTFGINEFQLGKLGAIYGMTAMAAYLVGGPLADRYSPRKLMSVSLVATGLGGLYMSTIPDFDGLYLLFGFWGASTILAFWAPLIRATREWGGVEAQGRAFGILDGGRGLFAALLASVAAHAFAMMLGKGVTVDPERETIALKAILYGYAACSFLAAAFVWIFVPDPARATTHGGASGQKGGESTWRRLWQVLRWPAVWLQAVVIVAAYSTFKMFDYYGLYAEDAYGLTRTDSAKLVAYLSFLRVAGALAAGWVADRFLGVSASVGLCFGLLFASYALFLLVPPGSELVWFMAANMAVSAVAFFGLRGIYFAFLEASGIPRRLTGTAVGVICFVGFTPEIFMPLITGWLIRGARAGGDVLLGYQRMFWILLLLSALGWLAAVVLGRLASRLRTT